MRINVVAIVTVAVVALLGGCAEDGSPKQPDGRPDPGSSSQPTPSDPAPESDVVDSEACEEVRLGIDAFNVGEFDETIAHFEDALPLAEEIDDGSASAGELVEAVRYYAELDAEDYTEAARSSPDFLKYKTITLGQCVSEASESPGVDV